MSVPRLTVHELGATDADVTEGTRAGLVDELGALPLRVVTAWQRVATVTDSNIWAIPGSSWEITAVPENEGSRVGMRRLWLS